MGSERKSIAATFILAAIAILTAPAAYLGGYFGLAECRDLGPLGGSPRQTTFRVYGSEWQAKLFQPASTIESILTGRIVRIGVKG